MKLRSLYLCLLVVCCTGTYTIHVPAAELLPTQQGRRFAQDGSLRQAVRARIAESVEPRSRRLWGRLDQQLERLEHFRSPGTVERMATTVAELDTLFPNDPTLATVRKLHSRANLYVYLDGSLLLDRLSRQSRQVVPISDNILGTDVVGSGLADTQVSPRLIPSRDDIRIQFDIHSETQSRTKGYNGPAIATTVGQSVVAASKQIAITRHGIRSSPTATEGVTRSRIVDFEWQMLLGKRIAEREARKRKPASEAESNRIAQRRVRDEVDQQLGKQAHAAVSRLADRLSSAMASRDLKFDSYLFRSTDQGIEAAAVLAGPNQLSTSDPYPAFVVGDDAVVQLHDSVLNNRWEQRLGGRSINEADWATLLPANAGIRDALKPQDENRQWAVSFEPRRPVVVRFAPNAVTVGLRATSFQVGERRYPAARIAARYVMQPGTKKFRRDGKLMIDVVSGSKRTIGVRQQVFKSLLRKRFASVFPDSVSWADWQPEHPIDGLTIEPTSLALQSEWATLRLRVTSGGD